MIAIKRWLYYLKLAWLDIFRLWGVVIIHVIIVAGICLPILLLLGLKRGHIAELRHDLVTSPTGRQIIMATGGQGELLTPKNLARIQAELGPVEVLVPDTERIGDLILAAPDGSQNTTVLAVTFRSTVPGDPILAAYEADVLQPNEPAVILFDSVAEALHAQVGDQVQLVVSRSVAGSIESATVMLMVKKIISNDSNNKVGYLEVGIIDAIERYVRGGRVRAFGWPASQASVRDSYGEYLLFSEVALGKDDIEAIHSRGYYLEKVIDYNLQILFGVLQEKSLDELIVYRLFTERSREEVARALLLSPADVSAMTAADDVVVPWNAPLTMSLNGADHLLIGLSLPKRSWLQDYMYHRGAAFRYRYEGSPIFFGADSKFEPSSSISLQLNADHTLALEATGMPPSNETRPAGDTVPALMEQKMPVAIVPGQYLARLHAFFNRMAEYDEKIGLFIPVPPEPTYTQARLYATTVDDVLEVIEQLKTHHYAFRAKNARIREIKGQDKQLQDLVLLVGMAVFFFGVITVISVLVDAIERKRGSIGVMRVMGVSQAGIFGFVFVRAITMGLLAGVLTWTVGAIIIQFLNWEPQATNALLEWIVRLRPDVKALISVDDIALVMAGSMFCCITGSIYPAFRASRMDPFEAIVEGKAR